MAVDGTLNELGKEYRARAKTLLGAKMHHALIPKVKLPPPPGAQRCVGDLRKWKTLFHVQQEAKWRCQSQRQQALTQQTVLTGQVITTLCSQSVQRA